MQIWKAHYKDKLHDAYIDIVSAKSENRGYELSFTLDGIRFTGFSAGDFELADESQYDEAKEKFNIMKSDNYDPSGSSPSYWYRLQRYSLDVELPVTVVRRSDSSELQGFIRLCFGFSEHDLSKKMSCFTCDGKEIIIDKKALTADGEEFYPDDVTVQCFSLNVDGKCFESEKKTLWFEPALKSIITQMSDDYYPKCCFTCGYADYSPYGSDDYGTMLCYRRHKDIYLTVNSKEDYLCKLGSDFDIVQETHLCDEYEIRNRCKGYRGFIDGIK